MTDDHVTNTASGPPYNIPGVITERLTSDDETVKSVVSVESKPSYAATTAFSIEQRAYAPRERNLTDFERTHFLAENVTPDRPCTATFKPTDYMSASEIFTTLETEGFPTYTIRCLQRRPNGQYLVTFSNNDLRNAFLKKSTFIARNNNLNIINDSDEPLVYLNVYDAPYELPDLAIIHRLKPYCDVYSYRRGKYLGHSAVFNGIRHFRVKITRDIPSFLRFGKFLLRVSHDGQQQTCRKCNRAGHFASACPNTICFNCDELGHQAPNCPHEIRCCICKARHHLARDCAFSWHRTTGSPPPATDQAGSEAVNPSETPEKPETTSHEIAESANDSDSGDADEESSAEDMDEGEQSIACDEVDDSSSPQTDVTMLAQDLHLSDDDPPDDESSVPVPTHTQELFTPSAASAKFKAPQVPKASKGVKKKPAKLSSALKADLSRKATKPKKVPSGKTNTSPPDEQGFEDADLGHIIAQQLMDLTDDSQPVVDSDGNLVAHGT